MCFASSETVYTILCRANRPWRQEVQRDLGATTGGTATDQFSLLKRGGAGCSSSGSEVTAKAAGPAARRAVRASPPSCCPE